MTGSIPTRVFLRELLAQPAENIQTAYHMLTGHVRNAIDVSPQQRAWLLGARSALAWVLGLPKTGKPLAVLIEGLGTTSIVSLAPADDWMQNRRDVLAGYSSGNFNTGD
jgi:hypothetical protein